MFKKDLIGKLFIVFGLATLIASAADLISILIPVHLGNPQWVYQTVQKSSDMSIIPMLGIMFLISGFYLINDRENKLLLVAERFTTVVCSVFAIFIVVLILLFSVSIASVEGQIISGIKNSAEKTKERINYYAEKVPGITEEQVQKEIKKTDMVVVSRVKKAKHSFIISNVKIFTNLLAFMAAYLYFAISLFKTSLLTRKKYVYSSES